MAASWPALLALAGLPATLPVPARAETTACTVVGTFPAYLAAPGHYCLDQDVAYTAIGAAINISADHVVLDCNHHRLANTGNPGKYNAVYASNELEGVVVRNCTLDAFGTAIFVQSSSEPGAKGNVVAGNTVLRSGAVGISVWGSGNLIERNRVSGNTGSVNGQATGIEVLSMSNNGSSNAIRDNVVSDFKSADNPDFNFAVIGIAFSGVNNTEVTGNTVTGLYAPTGRHVEAIASQGGHGQLVARNTVLSPPPLGAPYDGAQSYGIVLYVYPVTDNVCRDNVVGHFTSANLSGCIDSANTDF